MTTTSFNTAGDAWWVATKPRPEATHRLFCFPYAGGSALAFRSWHERLPTGIEVCGIQLPGRGPRLRRALHTNVHELVEELGPALVPALDRPFVFFGHSLGSVVGFELARWLRRHGHPGPVHLVMSGRRAPQIADTDPPTYDQSHEEFVDSLRRLNGTPEEIFASPELLQFMIPILRADFQMGETYAYVPDAPLSCSLTVFGGEDDEETSNGRLEAWSVQTTDRFAVHRCAGGHFFLRSNQERFLALLGLELARLL